MREIKFRAWDKKYRAIKDVYTIKPFDKTCITSNGLGKFPDEYILEQYTGLKDKNGKECFHNDLFVEADTGVIYRIDNSLGYQLLFINGDIGYNPEEFISNVPFRLNGEIIGNIHKNPELLK